MTVATETPLVGTPALPKPKPKANPNALLMLFRKYHTWAGVFAAGFVVTIAITGIYLNHKDTFRSLVGEPTKEDEHRGPSGKPGLPSASEIAALPIGMTQALDLAAPHLGDQPVEKVELRPEHGRIVYKVRTTTEKEVIIDAHTGAAELKSEYRKPKPEGGEKKPDGGEKKPEGGEKKPKPKKEPKPEATESTEPVAATAAPMPMPMATTPPVKEMDWGKAIKDLHTGKIGGDAGKLLVDFVAVILIVLTVSGLYLWIVPTLRKRRSARQRAAAAALAI